MVDIQTVKSGWLWVAVVIDDNNVVNLAFGLTKKAAIRKMNSALEL